MVVDEFKLRLVNGIKGLIDIYFADETFTDKMVNSTLKVLVETNADKIEDFLTLFSKDGEIDSEMIINSYAEQIDENGIRFNLRQMIKNDFIRSLIPEKSLLINKEDILNIIKKE